LLAALSLVFVAGAYADTGPKPDPAPSSSTGGPRPDPAPQAQPPPAPSPPPPAPTPPPPPPPPPAAPVYKPPPPTYTPTVQPAAQPSPAAKPSAHKKARPKVKVRYAGAKLRLPQQKPKPSAKPNLHLTAKVVGQTRSAPPPASLASAQTRAAPVRKPAAASAPIVAAVGSDGSGSKLALWLLIGLGVLGGLLLAGAALPESVLVSSGHRRLLQRRVDVAMTGATMLGCFLVLLALSR
jgi:hypothetical protein